MKEKNNLGCWERAKEGKSLIGYDNRRKVEGGRERREKDEEEEKEEFVWRRDNAANKAALLAILPSSFPLHLLKHP